MRAMSTPIRVLAFAGSLRRDSWNKKVLPIAADGARAAGAEVTLLDLRDVLMPLFDEDLERAEGLPDGARRLKDLLKAHDALLIASPEYNSSVTAALKNAIDWASREQPGEKPLEGIAGKVAGIVAASPGALGGLRGLVTLRSILSNLQVLVVPEQVAVVRVHEAFLPDGRLKDEKQDKALRNVGARVAHVARALAAAR
jgi:NAD(P)H-dependent FMN reductase